MKKALVLAAIAALMTLAAVAGENPAKEKVLNPDNFVGRANGTLGSVTITAQQFGPLQVYLEASATTVGGDGVPLVVTWGGVTYTLNNQVWLYGKIYDSPWNGGCTSWTASPGPDWCAHGEEFFLNSPTALGSFSTSFTTTVPVAMNYQTFVVARAGHSWNTTAYAWFNVSQTVVYSAVETLYVDSSASTGFLSGLVLMQPVRASSAGITVSANIVGTSTPVVSTTTDAAGNYFLEVPTGTFDIVADSNLYLSARYLGATVSAGDSLALPDVTLRGGDTDDNGSVELLDVTYVASRYGSTTEPLADINGSGDVDVVDISATASNYGTSQPTPWP